MFQVANLEPRPRVFVISHEHNRYVQCMPMDSSHSVGDGGLSSWQCQFGVFNAFPSFFIAFL